ncbi:hypothetical protein EMCRGX_G009527 [Ephydatia muelleri]
MYSAPCSLRRPNPTLPPVQGMPDKDLRNRAVLPICHHYVRDSSSKAAKLGVLGFSQLSPGHLQLVQLFSVLCE